jgi:hypothetical protein
MTYDYFHGETINTFLYWGGGGVGLQKLLTFSQTASAIIEETPILLTLISRAYIF